MTLFAHQESGALWLAGRKNALLGDVPGLGKTRTALAALDEDHDDRTLVVCPAIGRTVWKREADVMNVPLPHVYSYDQITRGGNPLMKRLLLDCGITRIVLDEFHYLKHADAARTVQLLGKDGYARRVPTWGLSGTPMPRHPGELWTLLSSLFPEVVFRYGFKTATEWNEHFTITRPVRARGQWRDKVVGLKNAEQLRAILAEVMLRRTLDDVGLDVPALFFQTLTVDVRDEHVSDLAMLSALPEKLWLDAQYTGETLADLAREPHVARLRRKLGELKAGPVAEMLTAQLANSDEKVVVFAHHRSVLAGLRVGLGMFDVAYIDGDVGEKARASEIARFQSDANCRVFLGQNIACKETITLTAARRAILVEPDWTPDVNYQLGKRIARIGSTADHCIAQMVALSGTLDEAIVAQNLRETRMVNEVLS